MLDLLAWSVVFVISVLLILKSASMFVDNLVVIGRTLGISNIILGVTASAIGTSLPEFGSALIASLQGEGELGIGVVVGANIWNTLGILGITAIVAGVVKSDEMSVNRDGVMAVITGLIFFSFISYGYFFSDKTISFVASIIMIVAYVCYFNVLIKSEKKLQILKLKDGSSQTVDKILVECDDELKTNNSKSTTSDVCEVLSSDEDKESSLLKTILLSVMGIVGLAIGCEALVWSIENFGSYFHVPELTMGLFVLALFTTLPELFVTLTSAIKGLQDISLGTVFGSCIFNILVGVGVPTLFVKIPIELESIIFDLPVMIGVMMLILFLMKLNEFKLTRIHGTILLLIYFVYVVVRLSFIPTLGLHEIYF
ncbi:MAG: calcium/sodium antiporter [Methanobrevibacter sp.]|jgi:cation:H+ antiporter|nr:calcium/sodium antiporter [Candidatus Methanovirga aequatorialis]